MRTAEELFEEYRKGDFHRRLHLYLQYRDLRSRFTQIDSNELKEHKELAMIELPRIVPSGACPGTKNRDPLGLEPLSDDRT